MFKNSVVNHSLYTSLLSSDFQTESELIYSFSSLGTKDRRNLFTCSTVSSVGESIPRSREKSEIFMFCKKLGYTKSTKERNGSDESFVSNSSRMGTLISPLSLADPIPPPFEKHPIDKLYYLILLGTNG